MNVGISVLAVAGAHVWSSGLNQNLAFLVMLLRKCESVQEIYLLNGGNVDTLPEGMAHALPGIALADPDPRQIVGTGHLHLHLEHLCPVPTEEQLNRLALLVENGSLQPEHGLMFHEAQC